MRCSRAWLTSLLGSGGTSGGAGRIVSDRAWGPVIVVEQLWRELGLFDLLRSMAAHKRFEFDFERAVFAIALQRILVQGSDRAGAKWIRTVHAEGFDRLHLPHFYRALTVLWQKKEEIELSLYERGKDPFNEGLDLAFFDTTGTAISIRAAGKAMAVIRSAKRLHPAIRLAWR